MDKKKFNQLGKDFPNEEIKKFCEQNGLQVIVLLSPIGLWLDDDGNGGVSKAAMIYTAPVIDTLEAVLMLQLGEDLIYMRHSKK